jgi:hypothetical protein
MADQLGGASGNATAAQLLTGYTASVASGPISGTIPQVAGGTFKSGGTNFTAYNGNQYLTSPVIVQGDVNLTAANIKSGVSILGVSGNLQPKQYASGSVTSSASTQSFPYLLPNSGSGGNDPAYYVTVSGLSFTPSVIMLEATTQVDWGMYNGVNALSYQHPGYDYCCYDLNNCSWLFLTSGSTPVYINSSGFLLPVGYSSANYNWIAYA